MKLSAAVALRNVLDIAIAEVMKDGGDEVFLPVSVMAAELDNQARDDLQAAIDGVGHESV